MIDEPTVPSPGRRIRLEPTAPGLWGVILGVGLGLLAPLSGFLIGTILGVGDGGFSPLAIGLLIGIVVGGLGLLVALFAGVRMYRHRQGQHSS